jgi:hypothetical protein
MAFYSTRLASLLQSLHVPLWMAIAFGRSSIALGEII